MRDGGGGKVRDGEASEGWGAGEVRDGVRDGRVFLRTFAGQ